MTTQSNHGRLMNKVDISPNMYSLVWLRWSIRVIVNVNHRSGVVPTINLHLIARMRIVRRRSEGVDQMSHSASRFASSKKNIRRVWRFVPFWRITGVFTGEKIPERGEASNDDC